MTEFALIKMHGNEREHHVVIPSATYSNTDGVIFRQFSNLNMRYGSFQIRTTNYTGTRQYVRLSVQAWDSVRATWGNIVTELVDEYAWIDGVMKIGPGYDPVHQWTYNDVLPRRFRFAAEVRVAGTAEIAVAAYFTP